MADRIRLLNSRNIDQLIILDIAATPNNRGPRFKEIAELCKNCFMPVTIGGGVRNVDDVTRLLSGGADMVAINSAATTDPNIIDHASRKFGSQAITVSIDVKDGQVYSHCGRLATGRHAEEWAREVEQRGAGEILLTCIEQDGTLEGFDVGLVGDISAAVEIPVIACGGCGSYEHLHEVLNETKAHAVAVGAAFQFCEQTPKGAARYLSGQGHHVRL